jgi:ankyrin repeat protein
VKKRNAIAVVLICLVALSSTHAQTTDFFELVQTGTPQTIQAAIDQGTDVSGSNKNGWTALMVAAANNQNPEVIAALIKAGADVTACDTGVGLEPASSFAPDSLEELEQWQPFPTLPAGESETGEQLPRSLPPLPRVSADPTGLTPLS